MRLHEELPHAVIGGAIEPQSTRPLDWALHVCDFNRYSLPFQSGPVQWVSDVNLSYKRRALEATQPLWEHRYHEPKVHWALLRQGETLYLASELVVDHGRPRLPVAALLSERFHWGRLFGAIRAAETSAARRVAYILTSPMVPLVLMLRHGRAQRRKGSLGRYCAVLPLIAVLLVAWTAGEAWGQVTKRG
jgi:hypothetical protein